MGKPSGEGIREISPEIKIYNPHIITHLYDLFCENYTDKGNIWEIWDDSHNSLGNIFIIVRLPTVDVIIIYPDIVT
jgi:hypothetical protein